MPRIWGLWMVLGGLSLFFNARRVAGTQRYITGRENKWEYGYYLQLRIATPVMVVLGIAILLGWISF